jgi:hypothetical protein
MNIIRSAPRSLVEQSQKLVVWVFRDGDGEWMVRREGDVNERRFSSRNHAVEFAHCLADASIGYKLFLQLSGGGFATEYRNYY